ncbi:MAG: cytochrome c [Bdellovibrionales bacterium]|nr:cytochrome c [Bdellovibrionales bacterium]NQZ20071.1 cytochrome c [Bdellovibrionales bacterium]
MKYLLSLLLVLATACTMNSIDPGGGADLTIDLLAMDMRHGWVLTTLPERSQLWVSDEASVARGEALYSQYCLKCHGSDGKGDGVFASNSGLKPANLRKLSREKTNSYLVVQINDGKGNMPKWEDLLTAQQLWDLTNYIMTFQ